MKNNKLIAEFMGCENPFNEIHDGTLYKVEQGVFEDYELKYHTSWDWLMPVVQKCYKEMGGKEVYSLHHEKIMDAIIGINLETTHKAVVEFINQTKTK
tara:strand:- start:924 stop:1217 length:294 start_codon:yes stop_codon:yes gene_type:complete